MYSIHPVLSAFPFALFVTIFCLESYYLWKKSDFQAALPLLSLAVVFVCLAFFSGYQASELADQTFKIPNEAISLHHSWGRVLLFLSFGTLLFRALLRKAKHGVRFFAVLYVLTLIVGLIVAGISGFLGGELVFKHGAGVYAKP